MAKSVDLSTYYYNKTYIDNNFANINHTHNEYILSNNLIDELEDILDAMIQSESRITVNITSMPVVESQPDSYVTTYIEHISLSNYKTNEIYYDYDITEEGTYNTTEKSIHSNYFTIENDVLSFKMPSDLSFENTVLTITYYYNVFGNSGTFLGSFYLYELEDAEENNVITVDSSDLPHNPPSE